MRFTKAIPNGIVTSSNLFGFDDCNGDHCLARAGAASFIELGRSDALYQHSVTIDVNAI